MMTRLKKMDFIKVPNVRSFSSFSRKKNNNQTAVGICNFSEDNSLSQRGGIEIYERFRKKVGIES